MTLREIPIEVFRDARLAAEQRGGAATAAKPKTDFKREARRKKPANDSVSRQTVVVEPVKALPDGDDTLPVYAEKTPLHTARDLIARRWQCDGHRTLHRAAGAFYQWTGTHYAEAPDADIRAVLYNALDRAMRVVRGKGDVETLAPFNPTRSSVDGAADALRAVTNLAGDAHTRTCWLDGRDDPSATEIVAMRNGLLHMPTRQLMAHDPRFFTTNALQFDYDADAPEPRAWLDFLASVWPDDKESIGLLRRYMGYLLSADTSQHKILLLVGPPRSGKGTIARTITALLGKPNVAGPTLADFARPFGLQQLIGKRAAIVGDARITGRTDQSEVVERLLSISGEDTLTVDRKHKEPWIGQLPARLVILTNELPRLSDASGALASRFLILKMRHSFFGREDRTLGDRIAAELPGILRWAMDGWDALQREGRFTMPASSAAAVRDLEELSSPILAFIRERCSVGAGQWIASSRLYEEWCRWCGEQGRDFVGTAQSFGRDLAAAVPGLETKQFKSGSQRGRKFMGIALKDPLACGDNDDPPL